MDVKDTSRRTNIMDAWWDVYIDYPVAVALPRLTGGLRVDISTGLK